MAKIIFLEEFGKAFVPHRVLPHLRRYLRKAGITQPPYKYFGALFYLSALLTGLLFVTVIFPFLTESITQSLFFSRFQSISILFSAFFTWFAVQLLLATTLILLVYFYLDLKIYRRTKELEAMLPDYLEVVSSNLKGGLTFENALWMAIKPRFRVLANEMAEVSKKVMTGYEVKKALIEFSEKYNSPMLSRTTDLVVSELDSGGNVAALIDRIVEHLKEAKQLKDDMSASAVAYVIFISVIVVAISPLLFALAYNLLTLILGFMENLSASAQRVNTLPFSLSGRSIDPEDFRIFSLVAIGTISFFSSLIVSIVEKGDIRAGVKYIPFFLAGSFGLYFLFMKVLSAAFSGII